MNYRALKLSDFQIASCTPWRAPSGAYYLELPVTLVFPKQLTLNTTYPDERQPTPSDYPFVLKAVGMSQQQQFPNVYGRFQWPNGKYWSNVPVDLFNFFGSGQFGRLVEPDVVMPPGALIRMQLENRDLANTVVVVIFFEGFLRIPMEEVETK